MTTTYQVSAWKEEGWWLARVVGTRGDADRAPVNAVTQARSLSKIGPMARDLIATILDADEDDFEVEFDYEVPADVSEIVGQAKGARAWLEAAQQLWQERSTAAARSLSARGYSLREIATFMGLSYQRVDQLLGLEPDGHPEHVRICECQWRPTTSIGSTSAGPPAIDALLVVRNTTESPAEARFADELKVHFEDHFRRLAAHLDERFSLSGGAG